MKYVIPEVEKTSFTCPYCNVLSTQKWDSGSVTTSGQLLQYTTQNAYVNLYISKCDNCQQIHIWLDEKMLVPEVSNIPLPNEQMPENGKDIYNEARDVFPRSAKASAALLRLALQHLCSELGEKGKNINTDIKELVKKGLPVEVQQALDIIRVTGNEAVHPGTMDLDDDEQIAGKLFQLMNFIVDRMIVQPREISSLFNGLPEDKLNYIKERDKVNA